MTSRVNAPAPNYVGLANYSKIDSYDLLANDFVLFDGKPEEARAFAEAKQGAKVVTTPDGERFKAAIEVHKDGAVVNGKSILGMMTLAAECGSSIRIKTDGEDAEQAMAALLELVAAGFHEMHLKPQAKEKEDA